VRTKRAAVFGASLLCAGPRQEGVLQTPFADSLTLLELETLNRDQLKYEDGTPVQFDGWADAFRMNIPERIAREMREQVIDLDADLDEYGKKLISKYAQRLRSLMLRVSDEGDRGTTPVLRGGRRRKGTRKRGHIVNPGETHSQSKSRRSSAQGYGAITSSSEGASFIGGRSWTLMRR
jgi:hypothetical protein